MYKVYGKPDCPQCVQAIQTLSVENEVFEYYCLTDMPEMVDKFKGMGMRQVPVVYKGDTLVGGFRELKKALAQ